MKILALAATVLLASSLATFSAQDQPGKDGQYRDPYSGEAQPAECNNSAKNEHPCNCNHADEKCEYPQHAPNLQCTTRCRPQACKCVNACKS